MLAGLKQPKGKGKDFYYTMVTAKLEAWMLAVDLSVLSPARLVPTSMARRTGICRF